MGSFDSCLLTFCSEFSEKGLKRWKELKEKWELLLFITYREMDEIVLNENLFEYNLEALWLFLAR